MNKFSTKRIWFQVEFKKLKERLSFNAEYFDNLINKPIKN